jgi:hypothetical protein
MVFIGEATDMGTSLKLSSHDMQWSILIRGVSGKNDSQFMEYHGKSVTAQDVLKFLPHWRDLVWQRIPDSMFSKSVSRAEDSIYEMDISATRDSLLSHEDVIKAFEAFMPSSP